jgi:hypothetical protein
MTDTGSLQLQRYLSARRRGATMMTACVESGIPASEGRLIEADIARDPSMLAAPTPSPTPAPIPAPTQETHDMASRKPKEGVISGEVPKPDFDLADSIHRNDIAPANRVQKQAMKDASDGWKAVKKDARVHVGGARTAFRVCDMEESEQQAWLRSFNGVLSKRGVTLSFDLVDQAEGKDRSAGATVVPIGETRRPVLATLQMSDGQDDDLAGDTEQPQAAE